MRPFIFLHYVLDEWFERDVQPRLKGRAFLIRYADDFVMGFSREDDARKVMDVLPKRFEKYRLTIHPEKTRLVPFERPDRVPDRTDPERRQPPGSFDLLGFTHYWARSRNGNWVVKRKTSTSRFRRGLQALSRWCSLKSHAPQSFPEIRTSRLDERRVKRCVKPPRQSSTLLLNQPFCLGN